MRSAGRERRRRAIGLVVAALVATAGCRDADPPDDDPTIGATSTEATAPITTAAATTTTTSLIPLDRDPPAVDLAYAQRVLDELNRLDHEASLILYRDRRVTPEHEAIMSAIYFGEALEDAQTATAKDLSLGLSTWRDPPGPAVYTARRLLSTKPGCIALTAESNARGRYKIDIPLIPDLGIVLKRNLGPTAEEQRINPSLWMEALAATILPGRDLGEVCR